MRHQEHQHLQAKLDLPVRVVVSVSNHDRDTPQMQAGLAASDPMTSQLLTAWRGDFGDWEWHIEPSYYAVSQVGEFHTAFHHGRTCQCQCQGLRPSHASLALADKMQQHLRFQLWVQGHRHTDSFMRTSSMAFSENGCTCRTERYKGDSGFARSRRARNLIYVDHETNTIESRRRSLPKARNRRDRCIQVMRWLKEEFDLPACRFEWMETIEWEEGKGEQISQPSSRCAERLTIQISQAGCRTYSQALETTIRGRPCRALERGAAKGTATSSGACTAG